MGPRRSGGGRRSDQREPIGSVPARTASAASGTVLRDVFPNLVEIGERIGMKSVAAHPPDRRRWLFSRSFLNASWPSIGFTRPLLRSSYRLSSVLRTEATSSSNPAQGILDDVVGGTSAGRSEILQFLGRFWRDVHFHPTHTVRLRRLTGKSLVIAAVGRKPTQGGGGSVPGAVRYAASRLVTRSGSSKYAGAIRSRGRHIISVHRPKGVRAAIPA